mmetsp:Transcript_32845/g.50195  ORF Transcript_32845/g.50195 Transcript_32845/m.50195 type:complete len:86 (+) Transcript_32845:1518-1775(+)
MNTTLNSTTPFDVKQESTLTGYFKANKAEFDSLRATAEIKIKQNKFLDRLSEVNLMSEEEKTAHALVEADKTMQSPLRSFTQNIN